MFQTAIWDPIERLLWSVDITLTIIVAYLYFLKGKKAEHSKEKALIYGFCFIFLGVVFDRFFRYISEFLIQGTFENFTFYGSYDAPPSLFEFFRKLAYASSHIGYIGFFMYTSKIKIRKINYTLSVILGIFIVLTFVSTFEILQITLGFANMISMYVFIYYILLMKWAKKELKGIIFFFIMGGLLVLQGYFIAVFQIKITNIAPLFIAPTLYIVATWFMSIPLVKEQDYFLKDLRFYIGVGVLCISISFYPLYIILIGNLDLLYSFLGLITFITSMLVALFAIKYIRSDLFSEGQKEQDILGVLAKPQRVTEEEVSISKEKRTCLVCKNRLGGYMFMCYDCGSYYCEKCANALTDAENACWACEAQFDKSKPVKPYEKVEEKVEIEEKK